MASSLALQLEALAVAGGQPATVNTKTRPSLLFSPTHAADIDLRTIFDLCESGVAFSTHFSSFAVGSLPCFFALWITYARVMRLL
jgi:hypothetical protein